MTEAPPAPERVERFSRRMIQDCLKSEGLLFLRNEQDDAVVNFAGNEELPQLAVWFTAEGPQETVYAVRALVDAPDTRSLDAWCGTCNSWNRERRWPRACAVDMEGTVTIVLDHQIDLDAGVHRALLRSFTVAALGGIFEFFTWFRMPDAKSPKRKPRTNTAASTRQPTASGPHRTRATPAAKR